MNFELVIPAFIAGLVTFLAPCTLPLVPGYLAFISGVSLNDMRNPVETKILRRKVLLNGLFFIIGFTGVFMIMGTLAGFLGAVLGPWRMWMSRAGGVLLIFFGLFMLRTIHFSFLSRAYAPLKMLTQQSLLFRRGRPLGSFILGAAFACGWTPCVGPILGSLLFVASTSATALQGAVLLFIFSLGLAIPFLLIAFGIGSASRYLASFHEALPYISGAVGVGLIFLGILFIMGNAVLLTSWGYRIFPFLKYDRLLNYL